MDIPRIGVGVLLFREGLVLLGKRTGSHGAQTWAPPGGHLEFGESPTACAKRELLEETGIIAEDVQEGPWLNTFFPEGKHYITLFTFVHSAVGTPELKEPQKCLCWEWFALDNLPSPLFLPLKQFTETHSLITFSQPPQSVYKYS